MIETLHDTVESCIPVTLIGIELDYRNIDPNNVSPVVRLKFEHSTSEKIVYVETENYIYYESDEDIDFTINDTMKELDRIQLSSMLGQDVYIETSLACDFQGVHMNLDNIFTEFE